MADAGMLQLRDAGGQAAARTANPWPAHPAGLAGEEPPASAAAVRAAAAACQGTAASLPGDEEEQGPDEDDPDRNQAPPGRHWHEDKVGLVLSMRSAVCRADPCPHVPPSFPDPDRVATIVRGLKKAALVKEGDPPGAVAAEEGEGQVEGEAARYEGPKLEKRQVVASRQSWPRFGHVLASAAWRAGFAPAQRKAFVADGAKAIRAVWKKRFSR
jgi:hypothetical protein